MPGTNQIIPAQPMAACVSRFFKMTCAVAKRSAANTATTPNQYQEMSNQSGISRESL